MYNPPPSKPTLEGILDNMKFQLSQLNYSQNLLRDNRSRAEQEAISELAQNNDIVIKQTKALP